MNPPTTPTHPGVEHFADAIRKGQERAGDAEACFFNGALAPFVCLNRPAGEHERHSRILSDCLVHDVRCQRERRPFHGVASFHVSSSLLIGQSTYGAWCLHFWIRDGREAKSYKTDTPSRRNLQIDDSERYSNPGTSSSVSTYSLRAWSLSWIAFSSSGVSTS